MLNKNYFGHEDHLVEFLSPHPIQSEELLDIFKSFKNYDSKIESAQYIFHFDNGYGASIIRFIGSYGGEHGLWEIGLLRKHKDGNWSLTEDERWNEYDQVKGFLNQEEVIKELDRIKSF